MTNGNCPYCQKEIEIDSDGECCEEDIPHVGECEHCEKAFTFWSSISVSYSPQRADCLNGGEHKWKESFRVPEWMLKKNEPRNVEYRCYVCHETKTIQEQAQ